MHLTSHQWQELLDQWHATNDAGEGYGIGEERQDPAEAVEAEGWTILARHTEGTVLAQTPEGRLVLVCDANGPWCVDVTIGDD